MRAAAFMSWFAPLFILYVVLIVGYHIGRAARIEAAERKARQERERIAAERKEKTEARKREQAAARSAKTAEATAQPKRKRGRPRKNPTAEAAALPPEESKPAALIPVEPKPVNNAPKTGAFAGEVVAFTGTCPKMERRYMVSHVNRLGGQGYETINTRCTLLVVAENPGRNQLDKAARWHVPIITWEEWWERAFSYPATTKPKPAEDDIVSLDQFASLIHNAA